MKDVESWAEVVKPAPGVGDGMSYRDLAGGSLHGVVPVVHG